jgi:hypothetical protein
MLLSEGLISDLGGAAIQICFMRQDFGTRMLRFVVSPGPGSTAMAPLWAPGEG